MQSFQERALKGALTGRQSEISLGKRGRVTVRKSFVAMTAAVLTAAQLCACGAYSQKGEIMEASSNASSLEESLDKEAFAAGIATQEARADASAEASAEVAENGATEEFVLNNEIEERCPVTVTAKRADVGYGEFTHGTYFSETCGLERGYSILLPADYSEDKKYPVLYLLHGIFGNEYSFSGDESSKIKEIVGNMAADGLIEESLY